MESGRMNDIERAINGMKGFYMILEPLLLKANYEGKGKEDVAELKEDIGLAIQALEKQLNNGWIPVSERLPQLPDGKSFMPLNATILAPSGLRNTMQMTWELKRGRPTWCYLGAVSDWNVIAWQPLPEPYKEEKE